MGAQLITAAPSPSQISPPLTFESPSAGGKSCQTTVTPFPTGKKWRTQKGQTHGNPEFLFLVDSWNSYVSPISGREYMVIPNIWIPQKAFIVNNGTVRTETSERPVVNSPLIKLDIDSTHIQKNRVKQQKYLKPPPRLYILLLCHFCHDSKKTFRLSPKKCLSSRQILAIFKTQMASEMGRASVGQNRSNFNTRTRWAPYQL